MQELSGEENCIHTQVQEYKKRIPHSYNWLMKLVGIRLPACQPAEFSFVTFFGQSLATQDKVRL